MLLLDDASSLQVNLERESVRSQLECATICYSDTTSKTAIFTSSQTCKCLGNVTSELTIDTTGSSINIIMSLQNGGISLPVRIIINAVKSQLVSTYTHVISCNNIFPAPGVGYFSIGYHISLFFV